MKLIKFGAIAFSLLFSSVLLAGHAANNTDANDLAVGGYDTVAYFTEGAAVEGSAEYTAEYDHGIYQFSSAENRDLFQADPAKYAPQFGGFCAYGAARSQKFSVDPTAFKVVEGKLYLNHNANVQQTWAENMATEIADGHTNWASIKDKDASEL